MRQNDIPELRVSELRFSDGSRHDILNDDIIVFVGPNNSGKSASLKELLDHVLHGNNTLKKVLFDVKFLSQSTKLEVRKWLKGISKVNSKGYLSASFIGDYNEHQVLSDWDERHTKGLGAVGRALVLHLSTEERLKVASPTDSFDMAFDAPTHPLHKMLIDEEFSKIVDEHFYRSFSEHIIVNRGAGPKIRLHISDIDPNLDFNKWQDTLTKINSYPMLHDQGDGMRSFVGVLISVLATDRRVILLDEPEAFLHPPQAVALGSLLTQHLPTGRQLFVATHSTDFLRGMLDSALNIRLIRLKRNQNKNIVSDLNPERLKAIWADPLLRYSKVMDGLFHDGVIVCEGDTDCRFYSSIIDALLSSRRKLDLLFVNGGGASRVHIIVDSLRTVGVPAKAIVDFDVLADEAALEKITTAFGADWSRYRPDWKIVKEALDKLRADKSVDTIKSEIEAILRAERGNNLSEQSIEAIKKSIRQGSGWVEAKKLGKYYITDAEIIKIYGRLEQAMQQVGLFIVPVGEVEGFYRKVPGKGPRWATQALENDLANDPDFMPARDFCERVLNDW